MSKNEIDFVTYTKDHSAIVKGGINAISEVLEGTDIGEKRNSYRFIKIKLVKDS